jgi:hypothetical protein
MITERVAAKRVKRIILGWMREAKRARGDAGRWMLAGRVACARWGGVNPNRMMRG